MDHRGRLAASSTTGPAAKETLATCPRFTPMSRARRPDLRGTAHSARRDAAVFDLTGEIAVVTGASSGLGLQMSHGLAEHGAEVIMMARRKEKLEAAAAEVAERWGVKTHPVQCDVTDLDQIQGAVEAAKQWCNNVDILVNKPAGMGRVVRGQAVGHPRPGEARDRAHRPDEQDQHRQEENLRVAQQRPLETQGVGRDQAQPHREQRHQQHSRGELGNGVRGDRGRADAAVGGAAGAGAGEHARPTPSGTSTITVTSASTPVVEKPPTIVARTGRPETSEAPRSPRIAPPSQSRNRIGTGRSRPIDRRRCSIRSGSGESPATTTAASPGNAAVSTKTRVATPSTCRRPTARRRPA